MIQISSLVEIIERKELKEHCRFLHNYVPFCIIKKETSNLYYGKDYHLRFSHYYSTTTESLSV